LSFKAHFRLVKSDFINYNLDRVFITHRISIKVGDYEEAYIIVL